MTSPTTNFTFCRWRLLLSAAMRSPTARIKADGTADLFSYDPAGQVTAAAYGQASTADTPVVFHDVALCCIHLQSLAAQGFGDDCALRPIASSGAELHVFRP